MWERVMIMKYKVYLDELDDKCTELINYSKDNIGTKINELEIIFDDIKWYGKAHSTYISGYQEKITRLKRINNNLELLAKYLKECHDNYNDTNNSLGKSWNDFLDEMTGDNNGM